MPKVKLIITKSNCRDCLYKEGDIFIVDNVCPPICHELWNQIYPSVYVLLNGGELDYGNSRSKQFDAKCLDEARVHIHGEVIEE